MPICNYLATLKAGSQMAGSSVMEILGAVSNLVHGASNTIILVIVGITMIMSVFLYKILFDSDFFSSYDRNL